MTAEEAFVLAIYRMLKPDLDGEVSLQQVANELSITLKKAAILAKTLVRGNYLKKAGEDHLTIMPHGIKLALLLEEDR